MSLTYTDKNLKTVLHSWGRFRVRLMEAVQPGDALSWYNSATYTVQEAAESDSQRADCFACEEGDIAETIWAALAVELKSASTVGTGGVVTQVYFAASGDDLGSPLYLGDNGKPSSTAGTTYPQIIGHVLARDRIILNVTGSATGPTFSTTITPATDGGAALGTGSLAWSDLFLDTLGVINFDNGDVTITHASDLLTVAGGNLRMGTNDRIEFRDADIFLFSNVDGQFNIYANATTPWGISLQAAGIEMGGYLLLYATSTTGVYNGQLWYDNSEGKVKYFYGTEKTLVSEELASTFTANITMDTDTRINFRDTSIYIFSNAAGVLTIQTNSTSPYAISLQSAAGGGIEAGGYLCLYSTSTHEGEISVNGQIWYNNSNHTFMGRADGSMVTFTVS